MNTTPEFISGRRNTAVNHQQHKNRSIFEIPSNFFDSCRLLESPSPSSIAVIPELTTIENAIKASEEEEDLTKDENISFTERLTCNICKSSFDALLDQRSHFKSDFHRFNVISIHLIINLRNYLLFVFMLFENLRVLSSLNVSVIAIALCSLDVKFS